MLDNGLAVRGCVAITAMLLSGCMGMERTRQGDLVASAPVLDPVQAPALPWSSVTAGIELESGAPSYAFDTGKSLFRVVELPASPRPLYLRVESQMHWRAGGYFQPDFLLLDSKRRVIRDLGAPLAGIPVTKEPWHHVLRGYMRIDDPPSESAYLLVRTTDTLLGPGVPQRELAAIPLVTPVAGAVVFSVESRVVHWPTGVVRLQVVTPPSGAETRLEH